MRQANPLREYRLFSEAVPTWTAIILAALGLLASVATAAMVLTPFPQDRRELRSLLSAGKQDDVAVAQMPEPESVTARQPSTDTEAHRSDGAAADTASHAVSESAVNASTATDTATQTSVAGETEAAPPGHKPAEAPAADAWTTKMAVRPDVASAPSAAESPNTSDEHAEDQNMVIATASPASELSPASPVDEAIDPAGPLAAPTPKDRAGACLPLFELYFELASAEPAVSLRANDFTALKTRLADNPHAMVLIEGHTDAKGDEENNLKLSHERALAVSALLAGMGVDERQLLIQAKGETEPVSGLHPLSSLNRRVVLRSGSAASCREIIAHGGQR